MWEVLFLIIEQTHPTRCSVVSNGTTNTSTIASELTVASSILEMGEPKRVRKPFQKAKRLSSKIKSALINSEVSKLTSYIASE